MHQDKEKIGFADSPEYAKNFDEIFKSKLMYCSKCQCHYERSACEWSGKYICPVCKSEVKKI